MKKMIGLFVIVFISYIIYYDVTIGSLPVTTEAASDNFQTSEEQKKKNDISNKQPTIQFKIVEVQAGDTVLSIVEKLVSGPIPVSISNVVADFKKLNSGQAPEKIQIGKKYKFPLYSINENK